MKFTRRGFMGALAAGLAAARSGCWPVEPVFAESAADDAPQVARPTPYPDCYLSVDGTDLSPHALSAWIAFARTGGGSESEIEVELVAHQDVDRALFPLIGEDVAVAIRSSGAPITFDNPEYRARLRLCSYVTVSSRAGESVLSRAHFTGVAPVTRVCR